jgi:regulatory protein YycI of two-component signal transduction system YycFG
VDWSKSKTIFIVVFLILSIFLYTQYLDVYRQGQQVEVLAEKTIEAKLKDDNITYNSLPNNVEEVSYISGKVRSFTKDDILNSPLMVTNIIDQHIIASIFYDPVKIGNVDEEKSFTDFANQYALEGKNYVLWEINKEERTALFFQKINDRTLYYNASGYLKLYWNANEEIYKFEQTMLEKVKELDQKVNVFLPIQVLQALYSKSLLPMDSRIISMKLGYSTLVQTTQKQVFAPTWEVRVRNAEGQVSEHFVNGKDGKVIDIQQSTVEVEDLE